VRLIHFTYSPEFHGEVLRIEGEIYGMDLSISNENCIIYISTKASEQTKYKINQYKSFCPSVVAGE
jgi:hypothetical protein